MYQIPLSKTRHRADTNICNALPVSAKSTMITLPHPSQCCNLFNAYLGKLVFSHGWVHWGAAKLFSISVPRGYMCMCMDRAAYIARHSRYMCL